MTEEDMLPVQFEYHACDLLQGVRLVGELELGGPLFARAHEIAEECPTVDALVALARRTPATFLIYLVGSGAQLYETRGYWKGIKVVGTDPVKQSKVGCAFEEAVDRLGLESFADVVTAEHGERYVTPILLHGTVPRRDVNPLAEALAGELHDGAGSIGDVLATWRKGSARFEGLRRPAQRFVRYGGPFVVDLLGRVQEAIAGPADDPLGLPPYIAEELQHLGSGTKGVLGSISTDRQPEVALDPWDGLGPELVLPVRAGVTRWVVVADGLQDRFPAPQLRDERVALVPGGSWRVEGMAGEKTVSRRGFEGVGGRPVFLFDPASLRLLADQSHIASPSVYVLLPEAASLSGLDDRPVEEEGEFPPLFGAWGGYRVTEIALAGSRGFTVSIDDWSATVTASRRATRAELVGAPVAGVLDIDGRPVYDGLPHLRLPDGADPTRWTVSVTGTPTAVPPVPCASLQSGDEFGYTLSDLVDVPLCDVVEIRARGPLGSDLIDDVAVVDGLHFQPPSDPVGPAEHLRVSISVGAGIELSSSADGEVSFLPGVDRVLCNAALGPRQVRLALGLPRVLWSVHGAHRDSTIDGDERLVLRPSDFADPDLNLAVRTGIAAEVSLRLDDDGGNTVQDLGRRRTSATYGRWRFALRRAADTVRGIDADRLFLKVQVGDVDVDVAIIERRLVIEDLAVEVRGGGDRCGLQLVWSQRGPARPRSVRLWSEDRPWSEPLVVPISDEKEDSLTLQIDNRIPAGPYWAEVVPTSAELQVPRGDEANVGRFVIPDRPGEGLDLIGDDRVSQALTGALPVHALQSTDLDDADDRVVAAILASIRRRTPVAAAVTERAVELLFHDERDSSHAAELLVEATHANRLRPLDRLMIGIEVVRTAVDCPAEALTPRHRNDLWESNRVLAAALDRPDEQDLGAVERWRTQTGWAPSDGLPSVGKKYSQVTMDKDVHELKSIAASALARRAAFLSRNGFDLANLEWMIATAGARDLVMDWCGDHRDAWTIRTQRHFPLWAIEEVRRLQPDKNVSEPAFPRHVTAAAVQYVMHGGHEDAARSGLIDAATFAPMLVERQLVLAVVYQLIDAGSIRVSMPGGHP